MTQDCQVQQSKSCGDQDKLLQTTTLRVSDQSQNLSISHEQAAASSGSAHNSNSLNGHAEDRPSQLMAFDLHSFPQTDEGQHQETVDEHCPLKSLHIKISEGGGDDWVAMLDKFIDSEGLGRSEPGGMPPGLDSTRRPGYRLSDMARQQLQEQHMYQSQALGAQTGAQQAPVGMLHMNPFHAAAASPPSAQDAPPFGLGGNGTVFGMHRPVHDNPMASIGSGMGNHHPGSPPLAASPDSMQQTAMQPNIPGVGMISNDGTRSSTIKIGDITALQSKISHESTSIRVPPAGQIGLGPVTTGHMLRAHQHLGRHTCTDRNSIGCNVMGMPTDLLKAPPPPPLILSLQEQASKRPRTDLHAHGGPGLTSGTVSYMSEKDLPLFTGDEMIGGPRLIAQCENAEIPTDEDLVAMLADAPPPDKPSKKRGGGRTHLPDPREDDPSIDDKKAKRIMANRLSAARSKERQKSLAMAVECERAQLEAHKAAYRNMFQKQKDRIMALEAENASLKAKFVELRANSKSSSSEHCPSAAAAGKPAAAGHPSMIPPTAAQLMHSNPASGMSTATPHPSSEAAGASGSAAFGLEPCLLLDLGAGQHPQGHNRSSPPPRTSSNGGAVSINDAGGVHATSRLGNAASCPPLVPVINASMSNGARRDEVGVHHAPATGLQYQHNNIQVDMSRQGMPCQTNPSGNFGGRQARNAQQSMYRLQGIGNCSGMGMGASPSNHISTYPCISNQPPMLVQGGCNKGPAWGNSGNGMSSWKPTGMPQYPQDPSLQHPFGAGMPNGRHSLPHGPFHSTPCSSTSQLGNW